VTQELQRLGDAFAMHLNAVNSRSASAVLGGVVYGLAAVTGSPAEAEHRAVQLGTDFLDRVGDRSRAVVAVGGVATVVPEIVRARATTDRILRVMRERAVDQPVATLSDVQTDALLLELRDLAVARGEEPTGPLARLMAYDQQHGAHLVDTVQAWLEAFGDVARASSALYVHQNTFRYRLRRATEVGRLDLGDARQRFALMLQLAIVDER